LIELLAVIAVLGVLVVLSAPMFTSISQGSNLNRAGQILSDQFSLARQKAVTLNRDVEVRFYEFPDGWRGVQLVQIDQTATGPIEKLTTRVMELPTGISLVDRDGLSPLLTSSPHSGTRTVGSRGTVNYRSFRFRPDGSSDAANIGENFVTLAHVTDTATPPKNFYSLQVNPVTGKATVFRP
jgi:uncharacterized protein (TIGR02596 family)